MEQNLKTERPPRAKRNTKLVRIIISKQLRLSRILVCYANLLEMSYSNCSNSMLTKVVSFNRCKPHSNIFFTLKLKCIRLVDVEFRQLIKRSKNDLFYNLRTREVTELDQTMCAFIGCYQSIRCNDNNLPAPTASSYYPLTIKMFQVLSENPKVQQFLMKGSHSLRFLVWASQVIT